MITPQIFTSYRKNSSSCYQIEKYCPSEVTPQRSCLHKNLKEKFYEAFTAIYYPITEQKIFTRNTSLAYFSIKFAKIFSKRHCLLIFSQHCFLIDKRSSIIDNTSTLQVSGLLLYAVNKRQYIDL